MTKPNDSDHWRGLCSGWVVSLESADVPLPRLPTGCPCSEGDNNGDICRRNHDVRYERGWTSSVAATPRSDQSRHIVPLAGGSRVLFSAGSILHGGEQISRREAFTFVP
jgi:hypothetical protein